MAKTTLKSAEEDRTGAEATMEHARKEFWEVQKLKQHAEEMEKKVRYLLAIGVVVAMLGSGSGLVVVCESRGGGLVIDYGWTRCF